MSQKQLSQWRTVAVVAFVAVLLVGAFAVVATRDVPPGEFMVRIFDTLAWTLGFLALTAAGKSSIEHLANGGGLRGAIRALLTEAQPGAASAAEPAKERAP